MADKVFINGRSAVHAGSPGKSMCFPDVNLCPPTPPAGPIPLPLPNMAQAMDMQGGASSVTIADNPAGKKSSLFAKSTGNEAAQSTGGGVVSHVIQGKAYFTSFSMDVTIEGEPAVRHLDMMTHNHAAQTPPNAAMGTYLAMMDPAVVGQAKPPPKQRKDDGKPQTIEIFLDHVQQTATGGIAALKLVSIDGKYSNKLPLSAASPKGGLLPAGPRRARETGGQELTERPIIGQKARLFFLSPKKGDDSFHQFIVAGLLFNLATGTLADSRFCLACSSSPHVIIQDWKAVRLVADLSARLRSAQPRGRLARTR